MNENGSLYYIDINKTKKCISILAKSGSFSVNR